MQTACKRCFGSLDMPAHRSLALPSHELASSVQWEQSCRVTSPVGFWPLLYLPSPRGCSDAEHGAVTPRPWASKRAVVGLWSMRGCGVGKWCPRRANVSQNPRGFRPIFPDAGRVSQLRSQTVSGDKRRLVLKAVAWASKRGACHLVSLCGSGDMHPDSFDLGS